MGIDHPVDRQQATSNLLRGSMLKERLFFLRTRDQSSGWVGFGESMDVWARQATLLERMHRDGRRPTRDLNRPPTTRVDLSSIDTRFVQRDDHLVRGVLVELMIQAFVAAECADESER